MKEEKLSGSTQENVLTLLVFDKEFCHLVRNSITPNLFESSVYRDIASHAIDFLDQFGEPINEHLPDSLEHILEGSDTRKASSYRRTLDNLHAAKDGINREFVIKQLNSFVRQQTIKSAIVRAVEAVESGEVEQAEVELQKGLASQIVTFSLGTNFADPKNSLAFLDHPEAGILSGIAELDKRDVCPRRKEAYLFIAPPKKGKSWALTHFGKWGVIQRLKTLHITLEMSEERVMQRYVQSFFSISKRDAAIRMPRFERTESGRLLTIAYDDLKRPTLMDDGIRTHISRRLKKELGNKPPLIIKEFPTGSLTIPMLNAYLDGLERYHKFSPDILILDYPKLMNIDAKNLRIELGSLTEKLRGIAVERNLALIIAAQGGRIAANAKLVTDTMISEDYSQIATADTSITYSQTPAEKSIGVARLFVSNCRNDEDKFSVLISQNYHCGQFCTDSIYMTADYDALIDDMASSKKNQGDDE